MKKLSVQWIFIIFMVIIFLSFACPFYARAEEQKQPTKQELQSSLDNMELEIRLHRALAENLQYKIQMIKFAIEEINKAEKKKADK